MPKISWEKLSELMHEVKNDRVLVSGFILRLKKFDKRLEKAIDMIEDIILENGDSNGRS